ncbi:MAG: M48 family metallopeptidase [Candidatus Rifleibacteriota bacterium]
MFNKKIIPVFYKGKTLDFIPEKSPFSFSRILHDDKKLILKLPSTIAENEVREFCSNQIFNWLKSQARKTINEKVYSLCNSFNLSYNKVSIKDTRSRWGSCSGKKNLNFNWRLIMAPEEIIHYIVVHETAHLQQMNHSKFFWNLVYNRCPDYKNHREWLKKNGTTLMEWCPDL